MTTKRTGRALLACTAATVLATTLAGPATASDAGARLPSGARSAIASGEHVVVPGSAEGTGSPAGTGGATRSGRAAEVSPLPPAVCPNGGARTVIAAESFADGDIPDDSYGWSPAVSDASGTYWAAHSYQSAGIEVPEDHQLFLDPITGASAGTTYLSFTSRGTDVFDNIFFGVNDEVYGMDLSPAWERVTVDVTPATTQYGGDLDVFFVHRAGAPQDAYWQVDDVSVFRCGAPPASGVRGDWTGEGTVDLLATTADGELYLYPGKSSGGVYAGRAVGAGWGSMTWIGSPGDINGDRRTDLLARGANGSLYLYPGRGDGQFGKAALVGTKWNGMTAFITAGDVDADGRPDLMARRSDGTLHLYRFSSSGTLSYVRQVGSGWNGMAWMVGMGDLNGDRYGDVLGVTTSGSMYAYRGSATGLKGMGLLGSGWGGMNWLTSPGDMNLDGKADLLARNGEGDMFFYPGKPDGVGKSSLVGSGWQGMRRIV